MSAVEDEARNFSLFLGLFEDETRNSSEFWPFSWPFKGETFDPCFSRSRTRRGEEFCLFPRPFRGRDETLENLCMIDCAVNAHVNHDPLPFFISISFFSLTFYESGISLNIFESTFFQIPKNKAQPS